MSAVGHITRDALSLAVLDLFVADTDTGADPRFPRYEVVQDGLAVGATVKRRQIAESMYMDDATQVQSSKARIPSTFSFFVTGHNAARLQANVTELLAALDQPTWELHVDPDGSGVVYAWSCWDAEVTAGFPVTVWRDDSAAFMMPIVAATLRSPFPVAGPV